MNCIAAGILVWCLGPGVAGPPDAQRVDSTLTQWENHGNSAEYETLLGWSKVVREGTAKGDSQVLGRLLTIAKSESQRMGSRGAALSVVASVADEAGAHVAIGVLEYLLNTRLPPPDVRSETHRPSGAQTHDAIVLSFVQNDMEHLIDTMADDTVALAFLRDRYSFPAIGMGMHIAKLAATCNVPADVRRDAAIKMIISTGSFGERWPLVEMLDPAAFPPLRDLVRAHNSVREFNYAAAGALAYHGDQEILPYLESLRPTFLAEGRGIEMRLLGLIWRIEVQHPPAKLLEYIASPDYMEYRDPRSWAVRRASQLGIEPDQIREAILTHEKEATTRMERWELPILKRRGLELGILRDTDLPNVTKYEQEETH